MHDALGCRINGICDGFSREGYLPVLIGIDRPGNNGVAILICRGIAGGLCQSPVPDLICEVMGCRVSVRILMACRLDRVVRFLFGASSFSGKLVVINLRGVGQRHLFPIRHGRNDIGIAGIRIRDAAGECSVFI